MFEIDTQEYVKETLQEFDSVVDVADVGEYLRVTTSDDSSCFGVVDDGRIYGWHVVEIDWKHHTFIYAPLPENPKTTDD